MTIRIGTAPDSWGVWFSSDPKQIPWERFLDEVKIAGYEWIEIGPLDYLPSDAATLQNELAKRGLNVTGTFVMSHLEDADKWDAVAADARRVGALIKTL